jgi:hypothetical protein
MQAWMINHLDTVETLALLVVGVLILVLIVPSSPTQQLFAGVLAGLLIVLTGISVWRWLRERG